MVAVEEAINFPVQLVHFLEKIPVSHDFLPPVLDCVSGRIVFVLICISNHVPTFGDNIYKVFSNTYKKSPGSRTSLQRRKRMLQATLATDVM
jgi:hypothetical protein